MRLSSRVSKLSLSTTLALDARAKQLMAAGRDIVNMSVGEPDFPAPRAAREAAVARIHSLDVRYTPAPGAPSLRAAIAEHLRGTRGVSYAPEEIVVCHSAKHALSGALMALVEPGDEVLLPLPTWVSYVELVRIAGGTPVEVPPGPQCRPELAALANAVTPRTRGVILNTPSNPTGYVWTRAEIAGLARLARERDLWILSDEIYRRLVYEGEPFRSPVEEGDDARRRTVIVDGASKSFAMTGYRVGFLAAERGIADAVARLHSQMTGSPNTVSQAAYEAALQREPPEVAEMVREYGARRRLLLAGLVALGLECPEPRGAFYAFPNVSRYLDERGSAGFCSDCLESKGLSLVPGAAFGLDAHVRLSYALAPERLHEALERLGAFLESHVAR